MSTSSDCPRSRPALRCPTTAAGSSSGGPASPAVAAAAYGAAWKIKINDSGWQGSEHVRACGKAVLHTSAAAAGPVAAAAMAACISAAAAGET